MGRPGYYILSCLLVVFAWTSCGSQTETNFDYGTVENGRYTNDYFKFMVDFPQDWYVLNREEMEAIQNLGSDIIQEMGAVSENETKASKVTHAGLFGIYEYDLKSEDIFGFNANISAASEHIKYWSVFMTGKKYLMLGLKILEKSTFPYENLNPEISYVDLGGREFAKTTLVMDTEPYMDYKIYQDFYAAVEGQYVLHFICCYTTPEQQAVVDSVMASVKFD